MRQIKETLDRLYDRYTAEFRRSPRDFFAKRRDPIQFPHRYSSFHDIEAAGFLAATFAYGNVTSLCGFVERLLGLMQPSPYTFLKRGPAAIRSLARHKPYYRLHKSKEILSFLSMLSRVYSEGGSLYTLFMESYVIDSTIKIAASRFVDRLRTLAPGTPAFLLPSPADGSTCKRLNLFFRWMVRREGPDFGLWREVSPAHLIMPVDTHIGRVAYRLGWIRTPSLSWQKAEAITEVLRGLDPQDPTRYDFSLCHESISRSEWLRKMLDVNESQPKTLQREYRSKHSG